MSIFKSTNKIHFKSGLIFFSIIGIMSPKAFSANTTIQGQIGEIVRETSGLTCSWDATFLLVKVVTADGSIWVRLSQSAPAYNEFLSIIITAQTAGTSATIIHDTDPSACTATGGNAGNLLSIRLTQ